MNAAEKALEHAIRCGRALNAAKSQMDHGGWLPWLKANFNRSVATATRYMRLAENSSRATNLEDAPSIRAALRIIAAEDAEAAGGPSCEVDDDIDGAVDGNVDADDDIDSEVDTTPPATTTPARQRSAVRDDADDAGDTGEDDADDTDTTPEVVDLRAMTERLKEDYRILFEHSPKHANKALMAMAESGLFMSLEPDASGKVPVSRWESAVQIIRWRLIAGCQRRFSCGSGT
ncbi:MAG UNVERIFIED_CONTAM: DUF3102 domain-containing protein [Planctomycetaceae bacterium]